jgi:hypothetical protein
VVGVLHFGIISDTEFRHRRTSVMRAEPAD